MKNNENLVPENREFLEHAQEAILLVYGKHYSLEKIQEAYTIAFLATNVFRDYISKIQRQRYGCGHCN